MEQFEWERQFLPKFSGIGPLGYTTQAKKMEKKMKKEA
jgi:hypothetical protein